MTPKYLNSTAQTRIQCQREFKCTECGNCCTQCGPITISLQDIERLAKFFDKKPEVIIKRHLIRTSNGWILKKDKPCKFYDSNKKKCKIYEARFNVCRLHPFLSGEPYWSNSFIVPEHCEEAIKICEKLGISMSPNQP